MTRMTDLCTLILPDVPDPDAPYGPPLTAGGTMTDIPCRHFPNPVRRWDEQGRGDYFLEGGQLWLDHPAFAAWVQSLNPATSSEYVVQIVVLFQSMRYRVNEINVHTTLTHGQPTGYILSIGTV